MLILLLACLALDREPPEPPPPASLEEALAVCVERGVNQASICSLEALKQWNGVTQARCEALGEGRSRDECLQLLAPSLLAAGEVEAARSACDRAGSFREQCFDALWRDELKELWRDPLEPVQALSAARQIFMAHNGGSGDPRFADHFWQQVWAGWWATQPALEPSLCEQVFTGGDLYGCQRWVPDTAVATPTP